jgi:hypothetical protein
VDARNWGPHTKTGHGGGEMRCRILKSVAAGFN